MSTTHCVTSDHRIARPLARGVAVLIAFGVLCVTPVTRAADEGGMTIKEGVLDELTIKTLKAPGGVGVIVRRFPADTANLGTAEKGDNEKREVTQAGGLFARLPPHGRERESAPPL
jgi:hypothetical protein